MNVYKSSGYKVSVVEFYLKHNKTMREVCNTFKCSKSSLQRWIKRYNTNKRIRRKTGTRKSKITNEIRKYVVQTAKKKVSITYNELVKEVSEKFNVDLSIQSILTILREGEVTRKRVRKKYYPEKLLNDKENKFKEFYKKLHSYTPKKIISLDETSIYINMTQTYGYSKRGQRAVITTHTYPFKRFNVLCAIRYNKVIGIEIYEELKGGVKQKELAEFINKYIKGKYKKNLILLDNAMPHRANKVKEVMKADTLSPRDKSNRRVL